jgi:Domain of unknown function (DUF4936)
LSHRRYVYYRVRPDTAEQVLARVRALHDRWCEAVPTLRCERLRRDDAGAETVTLMEVMHGASPEQFTAFEAEAARELAPWLVGERHVERFAPCA